jgi:hypothetical protein
MTVVMVTTGTFVALRTKVTILTRRSMAALVRTVRTLKTEPIGCPKMSVTNYQHTPYNIPEEQRPQLHHDRSLKLPCYFCLISIKLEFA